MSAVPVSQEAVGLGWLRPSPAALLALTADDPADPALADDPAVIAHLLRFARPSPSPDAAVFSREIIHQPGVAANAAALLEADSAGRSDGVDLPNLAVVNQVARAAADVARRLTPGVRSCHPDAAACLARLAPLGWYAVGTVYPEAVAGITHDGSDPTPVQRDRWGLDAAAITRRLTARWRFPPWAAATLGHLRFHPDDAARLGVPPELFRVVRAAVAAAERRFGLLGLTDHRRRDDSPLAADADRILAGLNTAARPDPVHKTALLPVPLIVRLLRTTAVARRASGAVWLAEAETRIDSLSAVVAEARDRFDVSVRDAKLAALAEFAAGASHEINNPLAVISGQAQLLLAREPDADRRKQLGSIVRQTKRLHELLQGTLQFARPTPPLPGGLAVSDVLSRVGVVLRPDGEAKGVTLDVRAADATGLHMLADADQARVALVHVVRNAIEAAPPGGAVVVRAGVCGSHVELVVEDDGPGPEPAEIAHLFDPFFSGRAAGRGRGLGLSIAWRYARINGGDVRYAPTASGPTRFILSFPSAPINGVTVPVPERLSA